MALSSTSVYLRPDYYKDDTPCLGKDHAKRKPNSHYFQNDGAKWRVKIEKDLNSFGENALYGVASNDHHFARTNTRSARDFQQSVHVKAQPSQHQEHAAMNDFNKPSDGRYFSQLPTCSSEFFQTELSKRSGTITKALKFGLMLIVTFLFYEAEKSCEFDSYGDAYHKLFQQIQRC